MKTLFLGLLISALILVLSPSRAQSVTIAIVDTGFDLDHEFLKPKLYQNESDENNIVAQEELKEFEAWKFHDNHHLKNAPLSDVLLQEVLLYRGLKAKSHQNGLTLDEKSWMKKKDEDESFRQALKKFKRHVHGTFVSSIALSKGENITIFPVRGPGNKTPNIFISSVGPVLETPAQAEQILTPEENFEHKINRSQIRVIEKFKKIMEYISLHHIRIVNSSYGVTHAHIKKRISDSYQELVGKEIAEEKLKYWVEKYFTVLYQEGESILSKYPNTLFVFSAGNSGQNNDELHHFPSRIKLPNTLSVAAMNGDILASFSNYGKTTVDIAAPGVGIMAQLPSIYAGKTSTFAPTSGTSMAAPAISNLAARMLDLKADLKSTEIKQIMMETGEENSSLKDKLVSQKIIHEQRALRVIALLKELKMEEAIRLVNSNLLDPTKHESVSPTSPTTEKPDKSERPSVKSPDAPQEPIPSESVI